MEENQIDQGIRLKKLIQALTLNQLEFAKSLGMSQPNISKIVNGGNKVSAELLNRIANRYKQVNLHWLMTGDGEMFFDEFSQKNLQANELLVLEERGRLEELEERVKKLEEVVTQFIKKSKS